MITTKDTPETAPPGSAASFEGREKRCPKCNFKGDVRDYFGLRWVQGKRQPQSWCFVCRRKPKPEAKPTLIRNRHVTGTCRKMEEKST